MLYTGATRKYIVSAKSPDGVPLEVFLLAPTFYDVRKYVDADMYRAVGEDVEALKKNGTTDALHDLESFPSRVDQIWQRQYEKLIEAASRVKADDTIEDKYHGRLHLGVVIIQALQHGNDHRTHICTILGHHDISYGDLDVWAYGLATGASEN